GDTVASIVVDGSITDGNPDPFEAIAVTAVDNTNGTWQYSIDGSTWNPLTGVTESAARLLDSSNKIRFVPDTDYNGSATFTFRAWDKFTGTAGLTANTSTNGDTTPFSMATDTASITINTVNDAPSFTAGADQTVALNAGMQTVPGWASSIMAGPATATDETGQTLTFNVSTTGDLTFDASPAIDSSGNLTYTPTNGSSGTATVQVSLMDDGGTANGGVDTSSTETFTITVTSDAPPTVANAIADVTALEDALNDTIDLTNVFTDSDNDDTAIVKSIQTNTNESLVSASISENTLTLDYQENQSGTADITVLGTSNGLTVTDTFTVTVAAVDDGPTVASALADVSASEDDADQTIDLSGVFTDIDNDDAAIVKSIQTNTNESLLSASISGNTLTLDYQENQSGTASITVLGTSNGLTVTDTFTVTVAAVADAAPTVANAIADVTANEDAVNDTIDLTNVFTDSDNDDAAIVKSIQTNTNTSLVSTLISGNTLTLDYQENQSGTAEITVLGTSNGLTVTDTFTVTVNAVMDEFTGGTGIDEITGTSGGDRITGGTGRDMLTGGGGSDQFAYTQLRDVGDTITDFVVGEDKLLLTDLFTSLSQSISDLATAKSQGFISFVDRDPHTVVMLDPDGSSGLRGRFRPLAVIHNVIESDMDAVGNFIF
ncbi:MAG: Ig-like domain-containing protein, partial [Hormoscilla sp.]